MLGFCKWGECLKPQLGAVQNPQEYDSHGLAGLSRTACLPHIIWYSLSGMLDEDSSAAYLNRHVPGDCLSALHFAEYGEKAGSRMVKWGRQEVAWGCHLVCKHGVCGKILKQSAASCDSSSHHAASPGSSHGALKMQLFSSFCQQGLQSSTGSHISFSASNKLWIPGHSGAWPQYIHCLNWSDNVKLQDGSLPVSTLRF